MNDEERQVVPQARQLKIKGTEGKGEAKKEPKEKEKPGNKWIIVIILLITIIASLIFKFTSGVADRVESVGTGPEVTPVNDRPSGGGEVIFGPAEYNFTK